MMKLPNKPTLTAEEQKALIGYLKALPKPKPAPFLEPIRARFETVVLPLLRDSALSELRRTDRVTPRLYSTMDDGSMGIVNLEDAVGGEWGDKYTKDATARVHRFSAQIPSVVFTTFVSEVWFLHQEGKDVPPREDIEKRAKEGLSEHPDRREGVMFNVLHYEPSNGALMQWLHTIEVIKVLGVHRSRKSWKDTKWGDITFSVDPMAADGEQRMLGRFIVSDPENDNELKSVKE